MGCRFPSEWGAGFCRNAQIADMGYGTARNIHAAFGSQADFLIRIAKKNMRLLGPDGASVRSQDLEEKVPGVGAVSFNLTMPVPPDGAKAGWNTKKAIAKHAVRLIGIRNSQGIVVWLLTNKDEASLSNEQACELYRVRWQVELFFKRLKSLGDLDVLRSREGPTARAALLAKMILLTLTNLISDEGQAFSPYGYKIRTKRTQPMAGVRLRPQAARRLPTTHTASQTTLIPRPEVPASKETRLRA